MKVKEICNKGVPCSEEVRQRLAEEALRNAHDPELEVRFRLDAPGALGDEHAARWLSRIATSDTAEEAIVAATSES